MPDEMTRQQFIDGLIEKLESCYEGDQSGFQVSGDDIDAVQELMSGACWDARSVIGETPDHD
jgi:hypothetical protein